MEWKAPSRASIHDDSRPKGLTLRLPIHLLSAPLGHHLSRNLGLRLPGSWIAVCMRGSRHLVRIFLREELIKTHDRALRPGTWRTDRSDYAPQKLAYVMPPDLLPIQSWPGRTPDRSVYP
jgi:hypothetical protein